MLTFRVSSKTINSEFKKLVKVISSRNVIPILEDFLFEIQDGYLTITASSTENILSKKIKIHDSNGDGKICINAKKIMNIIKEFKEQDITFNINTQELKVEIITNINNGKYILSYDDAFEFPTLPTLNTTSNNLTITCGALLTAIDKTIFAMSKDYMRPMMMGINCEISPDELTFVATDGYRLSLYKRLGIQADFTGSVIIKAETVHVLKSVISRYDRYNFVTMSFDDRNIFFEFNDDTKLICRRLEGDYPNYKAILPTAYDNKLIVNRQELIKAIKCVRIFANPDKETISLDITANILNIKAYDEGLNTSGLVHMSCDYSGELMEIGFNASYLLDVLENIDTTNVELSFSNPSRASLILPIYDGDNDNEKSIMLLMPVILNEYERQ